VTRTEQRPAKQHHPPLGRLVQNPHVWARLPARSRGPESVQIGDIGWSFDTIADQHRCVIIRSAATSRFHFTRTLIRRAGAPGKCPCTPPRCAVTPKSATRRSPLAARSPDVAHTFASTRLWAVGYLRGTRPGRAHASPACGSTGHGDRGFGWNFL